MKNNSSEDVCTKEKEDNIEFSIAFNKNGDSFQSIMEKILISKLSNNSNNE